MDDLRLSWRVVGGVVLSVFWLVVVFAAASVMFIILFASVFSPDYAVLVCTNTLGEVWLELFLLICGLCWFVVFVFPFWIKKTLKSIARKEIVWG